MRVGELLGVEVRVFPHPLLDVRFDLKDHKETELGSDTVTQLLPDDFGCQTPKTTTTNSAKVIFLEPFSSQTPKTDKSVGHRRANMFLRSRNHQTHSRLLMFLFSRSSAASLRELKS